MQNDYWFNEFYRSNTPSYFSCPFCQPNFEEYYRFEEDVFEEDFQEEFYGSNVERYEDRSRYPIYNDGCFRNKVDIENVSKVIIKEITASAKYIASFAISKELIHYIIKAVADYLNLHHEMYLDPMEKKMEALIKAIRKDMYWVFEILEVFGITPEMATNFIEDIVKIFLREIMPVNSTESSPMWGV